LGILPPACRRKAVDRRRRPASHLSIMTLDDAIDAHILWKVQLMHQVEHGESLPSEAQVSDSGACPLGQWLNGPEAESFRHHACFATLEQAHAEFHRSAAQVMHLVHQGDRAGARRMMSAGGAFAVASRETINALMDLRRQLAIERSGGVACSSSDTR